MANYLVTGGAGFIGSNLTKKLIEQGHKVRIIDNLSTGSHEKIHPDAEFIEADFTKFDEIKDHFDGIEGVFHVGALPRVPFSVDHPIPALEANVNGTLNVFVAARDAGVKRIVYSASSSAYGDQKEMPLRLDMPVNPMSPYALHKYIGEKFAEQFHKLYGLETVSLRYFNVYGPGMAFEGAYMNAIAAFIKQRKAGKPLTIFGDGEQKRDFTHISDVVRANILAMGSDKVGKGEVFNVGAGGSYSVNFIADVIGGERSYLEARKGEPRETMADISKTRDVLCWEPKYRFEDGLREFVKSHGIEPSA